MEIYLKIAEHVMFVMLFCESSWIMGIMDAGLFDIDK